MDKPYVSKWFFKVLLQAFCERHWLKSRISHF